MVNVIVMKKNSYGIGYRGSKNRIAEEIIEQLPSGRRFVDLFAGGCAITHAATLSGKWEKVLSNDLYPVMGQEVFRQACAGEFNKPEYQRIVCYDDFYRDRYNYGWIVAVWGWNNHPQGYIGKKYEDKARELGLTTVQQMADEMEIRKPLQGLTRLQRLAGTDLSKIEFTQMDYRDYVWQEGDVVYCDPPYKGTTNGCYRCGKFNNEQFWEWVRTMDYPVYVSEYCAPEDFLSVWSKRRGGVQAICGYVKNTTHTEHLFLHRKWKGN